jgi:6-phosphogluconolactonase (cycloisomerase 2 family)
MKHIILLFLCIKLSYAGNNKIYLFVGNYTNNMPDTGIYVFEFNLLTGSLKKTHQENNVVNPSFLDIAPNGKQLFVCTDTRLPQNGSIEAYMFNSNTGTLSFFNKQTSGGHNPIYVMVDTTNSFVAFGNYGSGSLAISKVNPKGDLMPYSNFFEFTDSSINKQRQEKSHVHATVFSPDNKFLFAPDLGGDKIRAFNFNPSSTDILSPAHNLTISTTPGSGPRHLIFHPNHKFAYCIEELSGTVATYLYKEGNLSFIQRIFACSEIKEVYNSADIHISPDGKFLYASNRGENTIAIFSVDIANGELKLLGHQSTYGDTPRNFTIDPTGNYLLVANQLSNNIVVFKRDAVTGMLTKTDNEVIVPGPSCLKMKAY